MLNVMKQSPLLEFESSAFPVTLSEDEETNPGIYGKALAHWIAEELRSRQVPAGETIPEDFGWLVPVQSSPHHLYVACSSEDYETQKWHLYVFAEGGLLARILGKDTSAESVASLFSTIKQILWSSPVIEHINEIKS